MKFQYSSLIKEVVFFTMMTSLKNVNAADPWAVDNFHVISLRNIPLWAG
jgi:hypothetical protein